MMDFALETQTHLCLDLKNIMAEAFLNLTWVKVKDTDAESYEIYCLYLTIVRNPDYPVASYYPGGR